MQSPTVSIVSGTYNRLKHLQAMIESVRLSVGTGVLYEIIIVDGGSNDGTIAWCKLQKDIVLIEQGKLLGAVKAFTAGFHQATGKYTIIGNDDIIFVNESIRVAIAFMEDNADVGIGCFYQNRYNKPWHVEHMAAVNVDGKQISVPYGQVCIVPKWLGDRVGWWGDYTKTYAGDNELSCNVLEMGFAVMPIPCACIEDHVVDDELRKINKGSTDYQDGTVHPDSLAYVHKWTRNGKLGPVIPSKRVFRNVDRQRRVLYAPIYEANDKQHQTKRGLREAFQRCNWLVDEVDYFRNPLAIFDVANSFDPDVFLLQFHDASTYTPALFSELKEEHPNSVFVSWNGDYFPEHLFNVKYMQLMKMFDVATFVTPDVAKRYEKFGINWKYWQIGYETPLNPKITATNRYDVVFLGNYHYSFRNRLAEVLRGLRGVRVGLFGKWPNSYRPDGENLYDFDAGHKLYMSSKITISDGRPAVTGQQAAWVSNRLYQALHAGCFVLQQWFDGIYDLLGLQEGVHFATYKKTDDLPKLIDYWLHHDEEREEIAEFGQLRCDEFDSFDARVTQLAGFVDEIAMKRHLETV